MGRDRLRVLAFTLAYLVLAAVSAFVLDWFVLRTSSGHITLGLRDATTCADGQCSRVGLGSIRGLGLYESSAWSTFWGTLAQTLLVGFQALTRIISGVANRRLTRLGVVAGLGVLTTAAATAYVFTPEPGPMGDVLMVSFERTFAPLLMMLAHAAGVAALYYAALETTDDDVGEYKPVVLARPASTAKPADASPAPPARPVSGPLAVFPDHLKKRLRFVTLSAELTRAGMDARREDGSSLLVMWRDVVGVIARRLPPELDGVLFVDLVSTAGSTLRVLSWTRLTGEPLLGSGEARARAFVTYIAGHCPEARIDPATRAFVENDVPAEQLETVDALAIYDARLG